MRTENGELLAGLRQQTPLGWALRYGLAVAAVAAAMELREALTAWVGDALPAYITFYPAVMVVALLAGVGPGLLTTTLAGLVVCYWILPPVRQFAIASPVDRLALAIFTGMGLLMSVVADLYRRRRDKAAAYDRETALRETRQENELLATLLEHADEAFAVGFPDGRLGRLNRAFEQLTGYTAAELRALDWSATLTPPEWREMEKQKLDELHRTGQPVRYEKEFLRKDGSRVPIELLVHLVRDAEGKPEYYYSFLTDISERRRAEKAARTHAEHLRQFNAELQAANATLAESRTAALNLMDDAVAARQRAEQATAELRQEVSQRTQAEEALQRQLEETRTAEEELLAQNQELIEARHAVDVEQRRYESLFEFAPGGYLVTDGRGTIQQANEAAARLLGAPAQRIRHASLTDFVAVDHNLAFWQEFDQSIASGARREWETQLRRADGQVFDALLTVSAAPEGQDAWRWLVQDISPRIAAEETVAKERANLQAVFDVVNVGMLVIDEEGVVKRVNDTVPRWVGRGLTATSDEQPGDLLGCVHALGDPTGCGRTPHCNTCRIRHTFESVLHTGQPLHDVETEAILSVNGNETRLWLEVSADPLELDGKRHVILAMNNITARKRAEEEAVRLATFPKLNPNPIVEADLEGHVHFLNPAAEGLFPDLRERPADHPWLAGWDAVVGELLSSEAKRITRDVAVGDRWYQQMIHYVEQTERFRVYGMDITERRRAQQEREITAEFLQLVNESTDAQDLIRAAAAFFQQQSGCEAVGIRVKEGDDYPYYEARGFPAEFVLLENSLCRRRRRRRNPRQCRQSPHRVHVRQRDLRAVRPLEAVLHGPRQFLDQLYDGVAGHHQRRGSPVPHAEPLQRRGLRVGGPGAVGRGRGSLGTAATERPAKGAVFGRSHRPLGAAGGSVGRGLGEVPRRRGVARERATLEPGTGNRSSRRLGIGCGEQSPVLVG